MDKFTEGFLNAFNVISNTINMEAIGFVVGVLLTTIVTCAIVALIIVVIIVITDGK